MRERPLRHRRRHHGHVAGADPPAPRPDAEPLRPSTAEVSAKVRSSGASPRTTAWLGRLRFSTGSASSRPCVFADEPDLAALDAAGRGRSSALDLVLVLRGRRIRVLLRGRSPAQSVCDGATVAQIATAASVALHAHHGRLAAWARGCPENFENRVALVAAEIARIERRDLEAMRLYEQAIVSASENDLIHERRPGPRARGPLLPRPRLRDERHGLQLRARRARLLRPLGGRRQGEAARRAPSGAGGLRARRSLSARWSSRLDVATLVKAWQAVAGEITLPRLMEKLMTITPAERRRGSRPADPAERRGLRDRRRSGARRAPRSRCACAARR